MKILLVAEKYFPVIEGKAQGGIESVILSHSKLLSDLGHEVYIFGPEDSVDILYSKVQVIKFPYLAKNTYIERGETPQKMMGKKVVSTLEDWMSENGKFDIILNHCMASGMISNISKLEIPSIHFCHNPPIYGLGSLGTLKAYVKATENKSLCLSVADWVKEVNNKTVEGSSSGTNYVFSSEGYPQLNTFERTTPISMIQRFIRRKSGDKGVELGLSLVQENKMIVAGTYSVSPVEEKEYFDKKLNPLFQENSDKLDYLGSISHDEVLLIFNNSKVMFEGDVESTMPLAPLEALAMGCSVVKLGDNDGVREIKNLLGDTPMIQIFRKKDSLEKRVELTKIAMSVPIEERIRVSSFIREYFSIQNWWKRLDSQIREAITLKTGNQL